MKLNKTNREEIITAAIRVAFEPRDAAHVQARTALGDALYTATYAEAEKIAKKLPAGWTSGRDVILIECEGFQRRHQNGMPSKQLPLSKTHLFPPYSTYVKVDKAHALYDQAQAIVAEHGAIEAAKKELRTKLHALVHSVATVERLRDAWPEGDKFLPRAVVEVPSNLPIPANLVADVNSLMGIKRNTKNT